MKRKFEFPSFYLLWALGCLELVLSVSNDSFHCIIPVGIVMYIALFLFHWATSGQDSLICDLLVPTRWLMTAAIIISTVVSRGPTMLCMLGGQVLILWNIERGYAYELSYKS